MINYKVNLLIFKNCKFYEIFKFKSLNQTGLSKKCNILIKIK
jgi:hypothetical protein